MGNFMTGYPTRRRQPFSVSDDIVQPMEESGLGGGDASRGPGHIDSSQNADLAASNRGRSLRGPSGVYGGPNNGASGAGGGAGGPDDIARSGSAAQCDIVDGEWMYNLDSLDREHKNRKKSHHHHGGGGNK
jgi:hypothetical protein